MKKTRYIKTLSFILCIVLVAAMALFTIGCNDNKGNSSVDSAPKTSADSQNNSSVLGKGDTKFTFQVTFVDGKETSYEIHTDKKTVGAALEELGLIAGEQGDYGLYVKTVDGATLDYAKDGKYWAFYVGGELATAGVDVTDITEGTVYAFKAE